MSVQQYNFPNLEVQSVLGQGGMATVWRARQLSLDRPVAVKVLAASFVSDPEDVERFQEEARIAAQLKHPGIVQVYDANFADGHYYFTMELVDGYTFGDLLRRKGYVDEEDCLIVAESVAVAMDYAWSYFKMVHCDIKPDNIMVDADGTVKVTDLGLSRSVAMVSRDDYDEQSDEILGTPAYMSPEQVYGYRNLDCRSDIYELGATLYHMLTGQMLFHGKTDDQMLHCHVDTTQAPDPRKFAPWLSRGIVKLLEKMVAKQAYLRQQNWMLLLEDLKSIRAGKLPQFCELPPGSSSLRVEA